MEDGVKLPTLAAFVDTTATALLLAGLLAAFWAMGGIRAETRVREYCDGLNVVMLGGDRYECVKAPRIKR